MPQPSYRRLSAGRAALLAGGIGTASVALVASTLTPVQAAAFDFLVLDPDAGSYFSGPCTSTGAPIVSPGMTPIVPNGAVQSGVATATASYRSNADPTDTLTQSNSISARARATAVGSRPRSLTLSVTGSTRTTASKATFACAATTFTSTSVISDFTLTTPTWASYTLTKQGPLRAAVDFSRNSADPYFESGTEQIDGSSTGRYLLQTGSLPRLPGGRSPQPRTDHPTATQVHCTTRGELRSDRERQPHAPRQGHALRLSSCRTEMRQPGRKSRRDHERQACQEDRLVELSGQRAQGRLSRLLVLAQCDLSAH